MTLVAAASSNSVQPGTLAFLVVFGMAVVLTLLLRSMNKHLRKVNAAARREEQKAAAGANGSAATGPAAASPGDQREAGP